MKKKDNFSARHYLGIYRPRLKKAEEGITNPEINAAEALRILVDTLSRLEPNEEITLDVTDDKIRFLKAKTMELVAEFDKSDLLPTE